MTTNDNYYVINCRLCGKMLGMKWENKGNAHVDCYWKWCHEAFNPKTAGIIEGKADSKPDDHGEDSA